MIMILKYETVLKHKNNSPYVEDLWLLLYSFSFPGFSHDRQLCRDFPDAMPWHGQVDWLLMQAVLA